MSNNFIRSVRCYMRLGMFDWMNFRKDGKKMIENERENIIGKIGRA